MCTWLSQGVHCLAEEIDESCQNFLSWQVVRPWLTGACFSQGRLEVPLWAAPRQRGTASAKALRCVLYPALILCLLALLQPCLFWALVFSVPLPISPVLPWSCQSTVAPNPAPTVLLSGPLTHYQHPGTCQAGSGCLQSTLLPEWLPPPPLLISHTQLLSVLSCPKCVVLSSFPCVFDIFIEISYHTIHLFHVYKSLVFSLFAVVQPSLWSKFATLSSPPKKALYPLAVTFLLSVWIFLFKTFHINWIIHKVSFFWFLSTCF